MLLANTMNRPRHVWEETKEWLSDGILYRQRIIAKRRGTTLTNLNKTINNIMIINIISLIFFI
jgi:hypothetical protein